MEKSEIKGFIAKRCAKELKNGDVVNLGIGLPTMIPSYLPEGVELIIHAELGIVSAGATPKEGDANYDPYHVIDAGGGVASVAYVGMDVLGLDVAHGDDVLALGQSGYRPAHHDPQLPARGR